MSRNQPPDFLFVAIKALAKWFRDSNVPHVIVGGVAASMLGRPRLTQDVDALIVLDDSLWEAIVSSAKKFGIVPRISNVIPFARKSRVLLMRHTATTTDIDVILGMSPFEEKLIQQAVSVRIASTTIRLPKPEDLILMKIIAGRPKDLEDIRSILDAHPRINTTKLRNTVIELADATASDQMLKSFDEITKR